MLSLHSPIVSRHNPLVWILWLTLGLGIVILPFPTQRNIPDEKVFQVEASRYAYTPPVLKVNYGDRVTINLVSKDVVHGLFIDGYNLETSADPGQISRLSFIADRPGSFRLRCTETCGAMHPFMLGKLQVGYNALLWRGAGLGILLVAIGIWRGVS